MEFAQNLPERTVLAYIESLNRMLTKLFPIESVGFSPGQTLVAEAPAAASWEASTKYRPLEACFPPFYFCDVLRGLGALTIWAQKTKAVLPYESIRDAVEILLTQDQNGDLSFYPSNGLAPECALNPFNHSLTLPPCQLKAVRKI